MDKDILTEMPKEMYGFVLGAQKHFNGVKDRLTMLKPGDEFVGGIKVLDTPGHTPGHISFEVAGDGGLIIMGDAIVSTAVFFPHPEWHFGFDSIPEMAAKTRSTVLERAAGEKLKLLGYHWPYPGLGFAEKKDNAYRYVPAA
jgi:glyoxylase-like metal-dependent hydrolase (beta-lactamase superfamily II)